MLRKLIFSLLFICAGYALNAQDTIYKVNEEKITAKVLEINPTQVKYKIYGSADGPLYIVDKMEVEKIVFSDGHTEYFQYGNADNEIYEIHPFLVGLNSFDLMFGMISPTVEYYFPKNKLSVKVNASIGLTGIKGSQHPRDYGTDYLYYNKNKIISTGAGLLFYPGGIKHTVTYFTGTSTEYGRSIIRDYYFEYPDRFYTAEKTTYNWVSLGVINGVLFKLSDRVNMGISATVGMLVDHEYHISTGVYNPPVEYKTTTSYPLGRLEINLGFRFGKMPLKG